MVETEEEDDEVDMIVRKTTRKKKEIFPALFIPRWMIGSLIGMHSVRAGGGATVWFGFHFSHLMEKESDAALIGFARWENLRLDWFDYVLTLNFRAYDTMSLHVYMHYGWMVGWMDGWFFVCKVRCTPLHRFRCSTI